MIMASIHDHLLVNSIIILLFIVLPITMVKDYSMILYKFALSSCICLTIHCCKAGNVVRQRCLHIIRARSFHCKFYVKPLLAFKVYLCVCVYAEPPFSARFKQVNLNCTCAFPIFLYCFVEKHGHEEFKTLEHMGRPSYVRTMLCALAGPGVATVNVLISSIGLQSNFNLTC